MTINTWIIGTIIWVAVIAAVVFLARGGDVAGIFG